MTGQFEHRGSAFVARSLSHLTHYRLMRQLWVFAGELRTLPPPGLGTGRVGQRLRFGRATCEFGLVRRRCPQDRTSADDSLFIYGGLTMGRLFITISLPRRVVQPRGVD